MKTRRDERDARISTVQMPKNNDSGRRREREKMVRLMNKQKEARQSSFRRWARVTSCTEGVATDVGSWLSYYYGSADPRACR